jgi:hypothetical protein
VTAVHVPFIKSRIEEVKSEIEKEKANKLSLEASIAKLMSDGACKIGE